MDDDDENENENESQSESQSEPSGPSGDPSSWEELGEETIDTDLDAEYSLNVPDHEGEEINLDTGKATDLNDRHIDEAGWSDSDDAQDLKNELAHDYSRASTETRHYNEDGTYTTDKDVLHNIAAAARRTGDKVVGWGKDKLDEINKTFGGTVNGFTSADLERNKEARDARNIYNDKVQTAQKNVDDFKSRMDPNSAKDQETLAKLENEVKDLVSRAESVDRTLVSTDTGSRLGNIWENVKEDLGDIGTGINQFFGGSDQYGLGKNGRINDRNGDGKTSFSERLLNMGRDFRDWSIDKVGKLGAAALTMPLMTMPGGIILQPLAQRGIEKGVNALQEYAKSHSYFPTEAELNNAEQEAMQEDSGNDNDLPPQQQKPQQVNSIPKPSVAKDNTPQIARNNWAELKLNSLDNKGLRYGSMNQVNDTMGFRTSALSDAHFKDFCLALMTDDENVHKIVKTKLMMDYFN